MENTDFVIQRYRAVTASLDYLGDTVANSLGDILSFGIGVAIARCLGFWRSLGAVLGDGGRAPRLDQGQPSAKRSDAALSS
ncbi:MAG: DUF2585 family protein [Candidatus Moduliflexus flocculans]|nr:DUF2585 family protein [Candidatus Moduliflexus flocculans]